MAYPEITLQSPIEIQKASTSSAIKIIEVNENPSQKSVKVLVRISENPYNHNWYTIWEGDEYDAIGQWTDTDLQTAVVAKVIASFTPPA